jgi:intracellular multiplication protein IcmO
MALDTRKYERKHTDVLRDIRPIYVRVGEWFAKPTNSAIVFGFGAMWPSFYPSFIAWSDAILFVYVLYFWWLATRDRSLAFKLPLGAKWKDTRNNAPGRNMKAEGILYLGNVKDTDEEIWFTNSDARTHVLYLGTTGSGKTEGLKSMVSNALTWGSGFIYVDGKADTDLWSSLSSLVRRFGRDDDLLVLNYMTGNSDSKAPSNTMNPFSTGSASYLTNMLVSLMPDAEGDNAMWKERAVSLIGAMMPIMTWKRDFQEIPMSVRTIRDNLALGNVVKLSRDPAVPDHLKAGLAGYLDTLPGFVGAAFDDEGREKPAGPDTPMTDTTTPRQQHGYLAMQFTRSLQSLGDDYGYIFDTQAADVDMVDVVLNRRILVVLIPALEKSGDETANLGKIVSATLKGMMGSTLGSTVEGESATVIENKPTHSSTPFMVVFDEVGYYTAQGMAVMAAQARSLGFSLIYSAQDLPAMEKRVKEESRSITANCNIKIFGKLEDPTQTKEFFEKTVGSTLVMESGGFQLHGGRGTGSYYDNQSANLQIRSRAAYEALRAFKEGQAVLAFSEMVIDVNIFYSNPGHAKAMRVTRFIALPPPDDILIKHASTITKVRDLMVHKTWTASKADVAAEKVQEIAVMSDIYQMARTDGGDNMLASMASVSALYALNNPNEYRADLKLLQAASSAREQNIAHLETLKKANAAGAALQEKVIPPLTSSTDGEVSAQAQEPTQAQAQTAATTSSGANPLSFFAKKPDSEQSAVQAPSFIQPTAPVENVEAQTELSPQKQVQESINEASSAHAEQPVQSQAPVHTEASQSTPALNADAQSRLNEAGKDVMAALFKKKDSSDAAE